MSDGFVNFLKKDVHVNFMNVAAKKQTHND